MIILLFICSIVFLVLGGLLVFGKYKYIIKTDQNGNPMLSKKEIVVITATLMFVGLLLIVATGLVLFTDDPNWLLNAIFGVFT
jgi:uncharacterized membrane protein SirB2